MSDREFENYLALLSRLLQLSGKHRARIASELRAHLDDRLEDLVGQGVPHDEAVRRALEEFGDAAGLAGQFVAISRNRKRRWLMRVMTFSVAATLLVAASLAIFWPGRNAAPGVAVVRAQASKPAKEVDPFAEAAPAVQDDGQKAKPAPRKSAATVIEEKLNQPTKLDVVEMPLKDVVSFLQATHHLPILLKAKKLEEAGISIDTPVTKSLNGVRLSTALDVILDEMDLSYYTTEILIITTPEDAQTHKEVRIYDCRDILAMPAPGKEKPDASDAAAAAPAPPRAAAGYGGMGSFFDEHQHRAQQLIAIITTNVDPQTWQAAAASNPNAPGTGTVSEYNGLIVVTQTAHTHKKIEHVLDMLREAAGLEPAKTGKVVR